MLDATTLFSIFGLGLSLLNLLTVILLLKEVLKK